ncbi:S9 family peptidase [Nitrospirillum iridis]|uniref:Dipeptidyl-peptidase-4 n=1 Tax=Nitrospirillum iridis TaxID=765888 RepID=A0A7X0AX18_9PROT|nr:S9 family peptidase [Nitrospirillum iridis]MBB6250675.1 dipeptidyl-peptidase-4 [Nitrospirillum iridis]
MGTWGRAGGSGAAMGFWRRLLASGVVAGAAVAGGVLAGGTLAATPAPAADASAGTALTVERMLGSPSLNGPRARGVKFSPDGTLVTYLKAKADNANKTDLWAYDIKAGEHRLLVDSDQFSAKESEEERGRRERQRIRDTGIVDYGWDEEGRTLLFPVAGDVFVMAPGGTPRRITDSATTKDAAIDARFAPGGDLVTYVRGNNLYVYDLAKGQERALTQDGGGTLSYGTAEFVAQEELKRNTGYWWSPGARYIAYTRVDESAVPLVSRYDYGAEGVTVVPQRYPFAGGANAKVTLRVMDLASGKVASVDLGDPAGYYLARVDWRRDGSEVLVQRLSRDQKRLDLLAVNPATGAKRTLLTEESKTFLNLHEDLRALADGRILWASERTGYKHLYLCDHEAAKCRALTRGDWAVDAVAGVDEAAGHVFFTGFREGPLDHHVYAVRLGNGEVTALTHEAGWHGAVMAAKGGTWLHSYSGPHQPPQLSVDDAKGERVTWLIENKLDEGHPFAPYLAGEIQPEFGVLKADDGSDLHYMLLLPPGAKTSGKKYPAIVNAYGGPAAALVTHAWGDAQTGFTQVLARNGYVVMVLDNRGTPHRGQAFLSATYHHFGSVEVADQVTGANYLKSLPFVDGQHLGFYGHSHGGFMTIIMLTRAPGVFAAGAAGAPVTDWRLYDTAYTERYLGDPAQGTAYEDSSVFKDLKNITGRLMVIHGMADDNVFFDNTTKLIRALQQQGTQFDLMTYPGQRHGFYDTYANIHRYNTMLDFFDRTLRPAGGTGAQTAGGGASAGTP